MVEIYGVDAESTLLCYNFGEVYIVMNNNMVEINSLIYDDSERRGMSTACSEIRHDRNRADVHGRIGYFLNGYYLQNPDMREDFFGFLRNCPLSRSISIDARFLEDPEILEVLRNSQDVREIRIINDDFILTQEVLNNLGDNVVIVCDEVSEDINLNQRHRIYAQHGMYKKETNFVEDDLVSAYFITHELSDRELDYLVNEINRDNSADYCQISFRIYDPTQYRDFVSRLHERGLREDVRINFLGNPLYDRSEAYDGLNSISNNPISVTYDTCSDMITFYTEEPYNVSNMHHSELEGGGNSNFDSYYRMLNMLEEQETHIREHDYSPLEAAIYAYRFLQQNYAYDPNSDITDSQNVLTNRQLDIVAGNSTLVCEGYATLYSALMRRCGIPMFRYSTDEHVRNIGRIVDPKYGVDTIGVVDPTFDGSHILDNGLFDESRRFQYFMFSPREAIYYDPYVTIPTSLVLNYEECGEPYLSYISRDEYENDLTLMYSPDGYAMTMLDRMGIQLPEPLTFESYRELVANLNRTSLFNSMNPDSFSQAYERVLRSENANISDFEVTITVRDAILSMLDRLDELQGAFPTVNLNGLGLNAYDIPAVLYPEEETLSISDFNKVSVSDNDVSLDDIVDQVISDDSSSDVLEDEEQNLDAEQLFFDEEESNQNGEIVSEIENNSDNYIPGTNIRKPRWRGDYETDEEYVDYLREYYGRYFPDAANVTRENSSTYRLNRDNIIQDLPINSKQESRFNGVMSDEEISISRGKLR